MKYNKLAILLTILMLCWSCEDHRMDNLSESKVYLTKSGIIQEISFPIGEDYTAQLWATKSGILPSTAEVKYELSPSFLDSINTLNGTKHVILPSQCYSIGTTNFSLGENDRTAKFSFTYSPEKIRSLTALPAGQFYALPFKITSVGVDVLAEKQYSLVLFDVRKPILEVLLNYNTGIPIVLDTINDNSADIVRFSLPVGCRHDNNTNVNFTMGVDPSGLDAYNTSNNEDFQLLSTTSYTAPAANTILSKGNTSIYVEYLLDRKKLSLGKYLLPVVISSASPYEIDTVKKRANFGFVYSDPKLDKTGWVQTADCSPSNAAHLPDNLFDNNISTYWQNSASTVPAFISIDMKKQARISEIGLYAAVAFFKTPKTVSFATSADNVTWTTVGGGNFKSITQLQTWRVTSSIARYVRMTITEKNVTVLPLAMGEIEVFGKFQ